MIIHNPTAAQIIIWIDVYSNNQIMQELFLFYKHYRLKHKI